MWQPIIIFDVWSHPCVVFVVCVIRDLLMHVQLLEVLDVGEDWLELLSEAL